MKPDLTKPRTPIDALPSRINSLIRTMISAHWKEWMAQCERGPVEAIVKMKIDTKLNTLEISMDYTKQVTESKSVSIDEGPMLPGVS